MTEVHSIWHMRDSTAFERLYITYAPVLRSFLAKRSRALTAADLDDLVQEVFVRAWANRCSFRHDASAQSFLYGVARNVLLEYQRCSQREVAVLSRLCLEIVPEASAPLSILEARECQQVLAGAMAQLSSVQRAVLEWAAERDLPLAEAARRAGVSPPAMRRRLCDARRKVNRAIRAGRLLEP